MDIVQAKICIPTSSGGHLTQMCMLMPVLSQASDRFWVTFDKEDANSKLLSERVYHCFYPTNRNLINALRNTVLALKIISKERPNLIISSGAAVAVPFFFVGKLFKAKCIYIEVFDRVDKPTLTGRLVKPFTDIYVVQWREMLDVYPGAICLGSIY